VRNCQLVEMRCSLYLAGVHLWYHHSSTCTVDSYSRVALFLCVATVEFGYTAYLSCTLCPYQCAVRHAVWSCKKESAIVETSLHIALQKPARNGAECWRHIHSNMAHLFRGETRHACLFLIQNGTGFSWFPCVYKRTLRWFSRLPVAAACFSCSPPDLNFLHPYFIFMYMHYNHCHRATAHLQLRMILLLLLLLLLLNRLWGSQPPDQWISGVKRPEREVDH
jgi:hypothetical protein